MMRNTRKSFLAVGVCVAMSSIPIHAQGAVSVPALEAIQTSSLIQQFTGYLTAIDTLYANYDMIVNTITQIENQYRQIQLAIERAKNIDWENIRFDGDFDIRNDIRDANRRVNRLLNSARSIRNALTTNVIRLPGGIGYSLADLCGLGADETKDIFMAAADVYGYMTDNMKAAAEAAVKGISYEEGAAIWAKYSISPANYWFCVQTENQLKTAIINAIAYAEDAANKMSEATLEAETTNTIVKAAMETLDSEGNMTEGAASQAIILLLKQLSDQCGSLKTAMREATGLSARKIMTEQAEKEAKAATKMEQNKLDDYVEHDVPGYFVKDAQPVH